MAEIKLMSGNVCLVDDDDYNKLSKYRWFESHDLNTSYAAATINRKFVGMHRFIAGEPKGLSVDHINGNGLDNRKENLRIVTHAHNCLNCKKRKGSTSVFFGVSWNKRMSKWTCVGTSVLLDMRVHIGYFDSEVEAALAYNKFAVLHNPYARLNQI